LRHLASIRQETHIPTHTPLIAWVNAPSGPFAIRGPSEKQSFLSADGTGILLSGNHGCSLGVFWHRQGDALDSSGSLSCNPTETIRRMIRPEALTKNEPLVWSPGMGADVWELFCAAMSGDLDALE